MKCLHRDYQLIKYPAVGGSKSGEAETENDILQFPRDVSAFLTQPPSLILQQSRKSILAGSYYLYPPVTYPTFSSKI